MLPGELLTEVLRGGLDVAALAGCPVGGGHSIDDPEPKYGMAVTGLADPQRLLRNDAATAGLPLSLTKPLGVGVLNNRHKATGEVFAHAVESMAALNADAAAAALAAGVRAATDVTGFGLLGHLHKLLRASGVGRDPRRGGRALPGRRARVARGRLRQRRHAAQPRLGAPGTSTRPSTRTSCCCSPTPRPAADCSSSARCPERR